MSNNVPVLMLRGANGKFFPVAGITGGGGSGGTGGASTAEKVSYTNTQLPNVKNVKTALDELVPNSHSHNNKSVLDKFAETDGKPTYDGKVLGEGGGASDFIIKMTVEDGADGNFTVTSCDATVEQIDAAVAAEKRAVVIASYSGSIVELPMLQGAQGDSYYFGTFFSGQVLSSSVYKGSEGGSHWDFTTALIYAGSVSYYNAALPSISTVGDALDELVPDSHNHNNKDTLDKLSDSNGALKYNNSFIIPQKVSEGTYITLADNTEYRLTDVTTLNLSYPTGDFECWMRLSCAASGDITVTLPAGTGYIGSAPDFKNGETWELSFKDKVLAAKKIGGDDKDAGGNGVTPHIGENGNWYIGNTDTGKPSRGENGVTPHIGDNGNWYIGSTDTGKPSRGVAGARGDTGTPGKDGKTPVKGTDYWTAADKQEIVNDVIAALPDGTEVSY